MYSVFKNNCTENIFPQQCSKIQQCSIRFIFKFSLFLVYKERIQDVISWSKLSPNCSPFFAVTLLESENVIEKYMSFLSEVQSTTNIAIFNLYGSYLKVLIVKKLTLLYFSFEIYEKSSRIGRI